MNSSYTIENLFQSPTEKPTGGKQFPTAIAWPHAVLRTSHLLEITGTTPSNTEDQITAYFETTKNLLDADPEVVDFLLYTDNNGDLAHQLWWKDSVADGRARLQAHMQQAVNQIRGQIPGTPT